MLSRLRTLPAIAGLSTCFLLGGVGITATLTSQPDLPPAAQAGTLAVPGPALSPYVVPVPTPSLADASGGVRADGPAAVEEDAVVASEDVDLAAANDLVAASESGIAPEDVPAGGFVPAVPAQSGPVVNAKSKPMDMTYTLEAPPEEPVAVILPEGILYQRVAPGDAPTSFQPVTDLPTDASVVEIIRAVFPEAEWKRAEMIAGCESGMRSVSSKPNRDGSRDHGIFQLNDDGTLQGLMRSMKEPSADLATSVNKALDPQWNVRAAHVLWTQRGWQPWTCSAKTGITDGLYSSTPGPNG